MAGPLTQIAELSQWLEANGFAVRHMGLRRSNLVSAELEDAKQGNTLTATTMSLFYATDFFDQLVHEIIPALRAGLIVLADRYIYTLMARDIVRGADRTWTRNVSAPRSSRTRFSIFESARASLSNAIFKRTRLSTIGNRGWISAFRATCLIVS